MKDNKRLTSSIKKYCLKITKILHLNYTISKENKKYAFFLHFVSNPYVYTYYKDLNFVHLNYFILML